METIKDVLNFCKDAISYDYRNIGIIQELNQVRKCIINSFYRTTPDSRNRECLSIFDDIIIKIDNNDIEGIIESIHDLREKISYMLAFEKLDRGEQQIVRPILHDDNDQE